MSVLSVVLLALAADSHRPRDPWVFRCVLDKRPRMVTVALSDEMWVAYDATHCGIYKVWKGGVKFDGPVYTTVHGPQPTTQGTPYVDGIEGAVWEANVGGKPGLAEVRWRGYRFNGDHVALEYEIALADGRRIVVLESPEFVTPELVFDEARAAEIGRGRPGLLRSFFARNLPEDVEVAVRIRTEDRTPILDQTPSKPDPRTHRVAMTAKRPQASVTLFFDPLPDPKETVK